MPSAAGAAQTTNKKNLTNDQRNDIIAELLGGSSNGKMTKGDFSRVAEKFGCYWKTISRLWKKYDTQRSNGVLSPDMSNGHKRSGRKGIDLQTLRDKLKTVPIKNRTTHHGLATALNIPKSTLRDNLKKLGLKASSRQYLKLLRFDGTMERTYIMIKPDGVQRNLVGEIIARFEKKGYKLAALKMARPERSHLEEHYADLSERSFFSGLIDYMSSGPVVCMVWVGVNVVLEGRKMLGATKPSESAMGTIRGDFCIEVGRNVCHGSDAVESAEKEIQLWFPEGVCDWDANNHKWVYEK